MITKTKEKEVAISLRRKGLSYSEILKKVQVAKSTLSLWLRSVGLSKRQKQRLTKKKLAAMERGWKAIHQKRIQLTAKIKKEAEKEVGLINKKELWLIGVILYWGEGHKEKSKGNLVQLTNLDPFLVRIFLKWLKIVCKIPKDQISFRIYLHETAKNKLSQVRKYWSQVTGFSKENFEKVSWKKHHIITKRKNIGEGYFGVLRVTVKKSVNLNRKIQGWINGICKNSGVV